MKSFIKLLTHHNVMMNINLTGGGSRFISDLLCAGGASKILYAAFVPYQQNALKDLIGEVDKCVSLDVAKKLAGKAYTNIRDFHDWIQIGIGLTASLAKDNQRPDRVNEVYLSAFGDHELTRSNYVNLHIKFENARNRDSQESILPIVLRSWISDIIEKDVVDFQEIIL